MILGSCDHKLFNVELMSEIKIKILEDLNRILGGKSPDLHEFLMFIDQL